MRNAYPLLIIAFFLIAVPCAATLISGAGGTYNTSVCFNVTREASTTTMTNYPILIQMNNGSGTSGSGIIYTGGKTQLDWEDVNWTDSTGNQKLNNWRENSSLTSTTADWQVAIPTIDLAPGTRVCAYFGNSTQSGENAGFNGQNTFTLYDDFLSSTYNKTQWSEGGSGTITISGGSLNVTGGSSAWGQIFSNTTSGFTFNPNTSVRYRWRVDSEANRWNTGFTDSLGNATQINTDTTGAKNYTSAKNNAYTYSSRATTHTAYAVSEISRNATNDVKYYEAGSLAYTATTNVPTVALKASFQAYSTSRFVLVDWVEVKPRQYPEPTTANYISTGDFGVDTGGNKNLPINSTLVYNGTLYNWAASGTQLPNGTYIVAWQHSSTWGTSNDCDVYASTSTDFGATWSTPYTLLNNATYAVFEQQFLVNNSTVYLFYSVKDITAWPAGMSDQYVMKSIDGGSTWGSPVLMYHKAGQSTDFSDDPILLPSGRILAPVYTWNTSTSNFEPFALYSDDGGSTWSETTHKIVANTNLVEPSAALMPNNSLAMTMRNYTGGTNLWKAYSFDDGVTWTPERASPISDDSMSLIESTQYGTHLIFWNNRSSSSQIRLPLTAGLTINNLSPDIFSWSNINNTAGHKYSNFGAFMNKSGAFTVAYDDELYYKDIYVATLFPYDFMNYSVPAADFTSNVTTLVAGGAVQFNDTSKYLPNQWNWSFGDGTYSEDQNPEKSYTSEGNYTVALTASNTTGNTTITRFMWVGVDPIVPINASFSQSPNPSVVDQSVTFTDTSTGNPTTWNWTFGDGNTSALQNPTNAFPALGTYTVYLNVTNSSGDWSNNSATHTVSNASGFTPQDVWMEGQYNQTVHVTDSSNGAPLGNVSISTSDGQTATTNSFGYAFITEPFGVYVFYFTKEGYDSKSVSFVVDEDKTTEVQMTQASTKNNQQQTWYTPHQVRFRVVDSRDNPAIGAAVCATAIASTFPAGSGTEWLTDVYGIDPDRANDMLNGTLIMAGTTQSDGSTVFTMHSSIGYNVSVVNPANGITQQVNVTPIDSYYTIHLLGSVVNNTYMDMGYNTTLNVTEPNSSYVTMHVFYQDMSGRTSLTEMYVVDRSNNTLINYQSAVPSGSNWVWLNYTVANIRGNRYSWYYNSVRTK